MKVPRIAAWLIRKCKGGWFDVQPRSKLEPPVRVDTVPKHAVKTDSDLVLNGVCQPIRRKLG